MSALLSWLWPLALVFVAYHVGRRRGRISAFEEAFDEITKTLWPDAEERRREIAELDWDIKKEEWRDAD